MRGQGVSHPTDLLPFGEIYAELELVVRQLDDGTLTVTEDDTLTDEERVYISAEESGLRASLSVVLAPRSSDALLSELERLSGKEKSDFVWRDGRVRCDYTLPWTPEGTFSEAELEQLYRTVKVGKDLHERKLAPIARGESAADPDSNMPPSFLPGAGQQNEDRATMRYGAIGNVPGRAELTPAERGRVSRGSERFQMAGPPSGGGGGSVAPFAIGMVLLVGGLGAAAFLMKRAQQPAEDFTKGPSTAEIAASKTGASSKTEDVSTDSGPRPGPRPTRTPEPVRTSRPIPSDLAGVLELARSTDTEDRLIAVQRWRSRGLDKSKGSRLRMLKALNKRISRPVGLELLTSFRESPVTATEALDCLEFANTGIWRLLVKQLGQPQSDPEVTDLIAEILGEQKDTNDLIVEEALIRLGKPKPGAAERLIKKRGVDWVRLGGGKAILASLPLKDLKPLLSSKDAEIRLLVCNLLGASKQPSEAVKVAVGLLKDPDPKVKRRCIEILGKLREPYAGWYLALAMEKETDKRNLELLNNALSRLPYKATTRRYLFKLAQSKKTRYRLAAVNGFQAVARPLVVQPLIKLLDDPDPGVRLAALKACQSLQRNKNTKQGLKQYGILAFRKLARDRSNPEMRRIARDLCYRIDGRIPR